MALNDNAKKAMASIDTSKWIKDSTGKPVKPGTEDPTKLMMSVWANSPNMGSYISTMSELKKIGYFAKGEPSLTDIFNSKKGK